jgi:SNF2 family DNA or RNA helicase
MTELKNWIDNKHYIQSNKNKNYYEVEHLLDETYNYVDNVPGLKTSLYHHQKVIVRAMIDLENNCNFNILSELKSYNIEVNAGVLSEKVGSGKTFDILALILLQPIPKGLGYDIEHILHNQLPEKKYSKIGMVIKKTFSYILRPTIIFVGNSVIQQWTNIIKTFTNLKLFVVIGIREYQKLVNMILDKSVEQFDIILIKNGIISRPILPPNSYMLKSNKIINPHIYSLLANIKGICWSRVVIDDFDIVRIKDTSLTINAIFTWYVSSTRKNMIIKSLSNFIDVEHSNLSDLLLYGNFPVSNMTNNNILFYNCNIRNHPKFIEKTNELINPTYYVYKFKNPNVKLINIMNELNNEMKEVIEMINADAIETAAERLGIKTTTTAGIFEKILGDQYDTMVFLCKIIKFINEQISNADKRVPLQDQETYGIRRLEKFEPILKQYPDIDKFLNEQFKKYEEQKNNVMITLNRIKDHIMEGECPICASDLKEECDGKIIIFKCCSIIMCEPCCFETIFHKNIIANCPNCRSNINIKNLIYINKEINLDELVDYVNNGNIEKQEIKDNLKIVPIKKSNYNKYDVIIDIIRGEDIPNRIPVNVIIPQLMTGNNVLPDPKIKKILIFANYEETLKKIQEKFIEEKISYEQLNGTQKKINETIDRFTNSDNHNILLICATKYCAGLNLQIATDLIYAHLIMDENMETQIAGRLIRLGRKTSATFHYIMFDNEFTQKVASGRMNKI